MTDIRTMGFKKMPVEIEIKDLSFVREFPHLLGKPHRTAFVQIIWVESGEMPLRIDFHDVTVRAEEAVLIVNGQVCQFDVTTECTGKAILFTLPFFLETERDSNFLYGAQLLNPLSLNQAVSLRREWMLAVLDLLQRELTRSADSFQMCSARCFLRIILYELERMLSAHQVKNGDELLRLFLRTVEADYATHHQLPHYAEALGTTERVLTCSLKEQIGMTAKEYIDLRIVLEAKRLLVYSAQSVKEIGYQLGFDEPTNFNKFFRKHTALTPLQFREQQQT